MNTQENGNTHKGYRRIIPSMTALLEFEAPCPRVPIAPLIEISCMCRFSNRRLSTRPSSGERRQ
ncbi:hypothetical protein D0894_10990 [Pseudomonas monteilii]|uniref:Uncharacterized protein n=1 Tax=Pseudomonas monteilii TaxID=76759 RepID=A0A399MAG5_9PSED|nr:hypothetical protein D0894_10990 [Pseudomonas monteilii]